MLSVSDQRVQRVSHMVYDEKINVLLSVDPHPETDLGEACVPVGRQFGLLCVKYSLLSFNIEYFIVAPEVRIILKGSLRDKMF